MRIWVKCIHNNRILADAVHEFTPVRHPDSEVWHSVLADVCRTMDISRPVILSKHLREIEQFGRTAFLQGDFMEGIDFDKMTMEILKDEKKGGSCQR